MSVFACIPQEALRGSLSASKQSFLGGLLSERNAFLRAAGVRGARSGIFFHGSISFVETVPTRYHTPLKGFGKCVFIRTQAYIYSIRTIVQIKCMPIIFSVGLFCIDHFEDNQTRTCSTFFRMSKLTELYFKYSN